MVFNVFSSSQNTILAFILFKFIRNSNYLHYTQFKNERIYSPQLLIHKTKNVDIQ